MTRLSLRQRIPAVSVVSAPAITAWTRYSRAGNLPTSLSLQRVLRWVRLRSPFRWCVIWPLTRVYLAVCSRLRWVTCSLCSVSSVTCVKFRVTRFVADSLNVMSGDSSTARLWRLRMHLFILTIPRSSRSLSSVQKHAAWCASMA